MIVILNKNFVSHFVDFSFQIVCEYKNVFASACAVARAFPLFSRKTKFSAGANSSNSVTVTVEFVVVNKDGKKVNPLSNSDLECMTAAAEGIRLAGRIVDTPCNDMHTDTFIQVCVVLFPFFFV